MNSVEETKEQKMICREYWLDLARAIAIVSVTFNHALHRSFLTSTDSLNEFLVMSAPASVLKAFLYVFSRVGVPLFLMISGALLIPRDFEDKTVIKRFIRHNWWELLRTTLIWLFIFFWYLQIFKGSVLRTQGFFPAVINSVSTLFFFNQTTTGSMWYMPMILCVYLMIPVVSIALKKLGYRYILFLSIIVLFGGFIIPNINTVIDASGSELWIEWSFNYINIFSIYLLYVVVGYWIRTGKLRKINNTVLWIIFIISLIITTFFQYWIYSTQSNYSIGYADFGVFVISVMLFEIIRRKAAPGKKQRQVTYLSKIAFAVFFVHINIMELVTSSINKFTPSLVHFTKFLAIESITLIISLLLISFTARIKFFRQYLYLIRE